MEHQVGLVRYGEISHAWVLTLPGCVAGGEPGPELDDSLRLVIAEYEDWLESHGQPYERRSNWDVVEELDGDNFLATGGEFLFEFEREPLGRVELAGAVERLRWAREDLKDAIAGIPDTILDWAPPREAFNAFDAWAPEVRTIRDVARHVLELEVYYRSSLTDGDAPGVFERVSSPDAELEKTAALLLSLDDAARSRIYLPERPSRPVPEEWTVRKVVRRLISHERVHTAEILQRRAWVLLGAPRSGRNDDVV